MFRSEALELGRFKRDPNRWQTEFGRWVADFGVPRVVAGLAHDPDLRVTNQADCEYLQGHAPPAGKPKAPLAKAARQRSGCQAVSPCRSLTPPLSFEGHGLATPPAATG